MDGWMIIRWMDECMDGLIDGWTIGSGKFSIDLCWDVDERCSPNFLIRTICERWKDGRDGKDTPAPLNLGEACEIA